MYTIGITGHQSLDHPRNWDWVRTQIGNVLCRVPSPWQGLSSLAKGADQIFADLVITSGSPLAVVLPNEKYEQTFAPGSERELYRGLLKQATQVVTLSGASSEQESYFTAGKRIVDQSDELIAVWDGAPAKGLGGTGDIVAYALAARKKILHINPVSHRVEQR